MPSCIKKDYKQLTIRLIKAEKLPKVDTFGSIDAYIQLTLFSRKLKTNVVTMANNLVQWD